MEALIDEWFPGLRNVTMTSSDQMVKPCALCPFCSGVCVCVCVCVFVDTISKIHAVNSILILNCQILLFTLPLN